MSEQSLKEKAAKVRMDLLPPEPIEGAAKCLQFGADKHGERGWENEPMTYGMVLAALKRHLNKFEMGIDKDDEMNVLHMDAVVTNAMILSTYQHRGIGRDDLPSRHLRAPGSIRQMSYSDTICKNCGADLALPNSFKTGLCMVCRGGITKEEREEVLKGVIK